VPGAQPCRRPGFTLAPVRTLIVGHGGRESALAYRMAEHSELHAFVGHENPSILSAAAGSGGGHLVGDVCDPKAVAAFAHERKIDVAMVSADEPLAAGVVDALLAQGTLAVGPTAAGAEIEWNKAFARSLLSEVAPEAVPEMRVVSDARGVDAGDDEIGADMALVAEEVLFQHGHDGDDAWGSAGGQGVEFKVRGDEGSGEFGVGSCAGAGAEDRRGDVVELFAVLMKEWEFSFSLGDGRGWN